MIRALSLEEFVAIIRRHPNVIRRFIDIESETLAQAYGKMSDIALADVPLVRDVVATAMDSPAAADAMRISMRMVAVARVAGLTVNLHSVDVLAGIFMEEVGNLCFGNVTSAEREPLPARLSLVQGGRA